MSDADHEGVSSDYVPIGKAVSEGVEITAKVARQLKRLREVFISVIPITHLPAIEVDPFSPGCRQPCLPDTGL